MSRPNFGWNEYFTNSPTTTLGPGEYNSQRSYSSGSIYILKCLFNKFTSGSHGGALSFSSSVTYLLIESSSFFSCKTSNSWGGAIFFQNSGGRCVLHEVCGYDCSSNPYYQFAYIEVNNGVSSKNYVNYSSISNCVNSNSNSQHTLVLHNGKIYCPSVNLSMNKCYHYSGIYCYPYSDSSSVICSLSYSTFADNVASGFICIYFDRDGAKYEIKCCNILRNTQVSTSNGLIFGPGNMIIEDSCILENTANYIFYVYSSYTITLSNCTVDKTTNNGRLTIQNTVTKSFIHGLNHMSTQNCHSVYDSAGYLSVVPYVPRSTQKVFCYTNRMNQYQVRISDFFTLLWIFLFTFIHPNPSVIVGTTSTDFVDKISNFISKSCN
jgi:hypothetical protein